MELSDIAYLASGTAGAGGGAAWLVRMAINGFSKKLDGLDKQITDHRLDVTKQIGQLREDITRTREEVVRNQTHIDILKEQVVTS